MTNRQEIFFKTVLPIAQKHADGSIISAKDLCVLCVSHGLPGGVPTFANVSRVGRGMYDLSLLAGQAMGQMPTVECMTPAPVDERTDDEIETEITERFNALDRMMFGVVAGTYRAIIASGNAGIGKTYGAEYILEGAAHGEKIRLTSVKGYVKPTGIYRLLWECKDPGSVLVFDDSDSVFDDEIGLNLLKGALDTTKRRTISWRSEKEFEAEDGEAIPNSFDFNGAVVFITNKNFDREMSRGSKLAPHLEALISRSYYVDLNLAPRDLLIRIKSVINKTEMLDSCNKSEKKYIIEFMEKHLRDLRELSLRMALKLAALLKGAKDRNDFEMMARATCLRRVR